MKVPLGKMKDGKKEGKWMVWYENGTKKEEHNFKDGKKEGKWMVWYDNGTKKEEHNFKDGKKNGLTTEWRKNGIKERETQYLNDEVYGLETIYTEVGGVFTEIDWIDSLNYIGSRFYEDGTIMTRGKFVNKEPYEGQFYGMNKLEGTFRKSLFDFRKTIKTYEEGKLIKIDWYENNDYENREIIRVDDCINTDDCLSEKEWEKKYNKLSEKKVIYEQSPFKILYQVRTNYGKDKEIDIFTIYTGQNILRYVSIRCLYFKNGNQIDTEKIRMGPFVDYMDDDKVTLYPKNIDFDELKVEIVKYE